MFTAGNKVANMFTVGCLVLAGVLSVNTVNVVESAETLGAGLATQATIWLLNNKETGSDNVFLCSATIIERDHILTHSKCIEYYKATNLVIALGTVYLNATETFNKVTNITYEAGTEMALLRTAEDTFATSSVATLRNKALGPDSKCVVSGWFDASTPWKEQEVMYITDAECKEEYNATHATVEEGNICVQGPPGKNCGSLGMPLTCDDQLTGLFSMTDFQCKLPAQCTGVPHSKAWIEKQLALARGGATSVRPSLFAAIAALLLAYKTLLPRNHKLY